MQRLREAEKRNTEPERMDPEGGRGEGGDPGRERGN